MQIAIGVARTRKVCRRAFARLESIFEPEETLRSDRRATGFFRDAIINKRSRSR